ncbi:hypothetical protein CN918_29795 [Priestia megaterium]|nr:hypothetical protein CN918_29795 [Priestia megaterium]
MYKGKVYVLSNESMPGLYKIGCTTTSVEKRVQELSAPTGIPTPFKEEFSILTDDPRESEKILHDELKDYRISPSREFFKADLDTIKSAMNLLLTNAEKTFHICKDSIEIPIESYCQKMKDDTHVLTLFKEKEWFENSNYEYDKVVSKIKHIKNFIEHEGKIYLSLVMPCIGDADDFKKMLNNLKDSIEKINPDEVNDEDNFFEDPSLVKKEEVCDEDDFFEDPSLVKKEKVCDEHKNNFFIKEDKQNEDVKVVKAFF